MLVDPELYEITNGQRGMLKGIDACIRAQCLVSAVALIYSAMDALAALTRPQDANDTTRGEFLDWVKTYLCPIEKLGCSAEDLYGARCGILHTYGPHSRLRRQGAAKALVYKWKGGPAPDRQHSTMIPPDAITLCVEDLRDAVEEAVVSLLAAVDLDQDLKSRVDRHRQELLCYRPWSAVPILVAA
jgi:hypothetical protein